LDPVGNATTISKLYVSRMPLYISPAVVSAFATCDRSELQKLLVENRAHLSVARWRSLKRWIANRIISFGILLAFLPLAMSGYYYFSNNLYLSILIGTPLFLFVLWLFGTNPVLNGRGRQMGSLEEAAHDEYRMYAYTVSVIKRRIRKLPK
jgi:hypothetical protein